MNFFDDDEDEVGSPRRETSAETIAAGVPVASGSGSRPAGAAAYQRESSTSLGSRIVSSSSQRGQSSSVRASSAAPSDTGYRDRERDYRNGNRHQGRDSPSLEDILGRDFAANKERNVQKLMRAWNNESGAPELLVFPRELVETIVKDLARRRVIVQNAHSQAGHPEGFYTSAALIATENMRVAHVLKSFLRERLYKIERFARYYLDAFRIASEKMDFERDQEDQDALIRMYDNELNHARGYVAITDSYFKTAVVDAMPEKVASRLQDVNIHPRPDFSEAVYIRVKRDCGNIVLPDGDLLYLEKDSQHMLRYSSVRHLLRKDWIDLL